MRGVMMGRLIGIAPLLAGIYRKAPQWLRGAFSWMTNGKVIVGVCGVLLNDADQVLLLRHRFHDARAWGLPGGWLSPGEDIFACWLREIREELALDAAVEGIICHRATRRTLEFYLLGRIGGGQLKIDPVEILEARFFSVDELPPMGRFNASVIGRALRYPARAEATSGPVETNARPAGGSEGKLAPGREDGELRSVSGKPKGEGGA